MKKLLSSQSRIASLFLLFVILSISNSCTKDSPEPDPGKGGNTPGTSNGPGTNQVWIQGMAFTPADITVTAGTTITWTNKDNIIHDVTSNTSLFSSGSLANGATFSFTFNTVGTYPYICSIHPSMVGTVTVKEASTPGY
jgi:plastocyanin